MGNLKVVKQLTLNENLLMVSMILAILGYYVIAEWQVLGGLLTVFSGYGIMAMLLNWLEKFAVFLF